MPKSKQSHSPALVDEPASKRRKNHLSRAKIEKISKQADPMVNSARPQIFQPGYACHSRLSPLEAPFANGDTYNFLAEHQLRDCFSVREYSNLTGNVNNCIGQYGANFSPEPEWRNDDSAMDLRRHNMTTLCNFTDFSPLFNVSIDRDIQASTTGYYTNILTNSIPSAAGTPDLCKMLLGTTYPAVGGLDYDFRTPPAQTIPDTLHSVMEEAGTPANSVPEANPKSPVMENSGTWWRESGPRGPAAEQENLGMMQKLEIRGLSDTDELDIKSTTSKQLGQHIGKAEQVSELWRDRNHIDEAVLDLRKLEGRLQGWNKHQMVAVTSTG